jgi:DUF1680 family protein
MTIYTKITQGFWRDRQMLNASTTIFHQWEQLEASGCINNFRLAAGQMDTFREGYFFADSDAYKWLDAASRILGSDPSPRLKILVDDFIILLEAVQQPDGYLYTYNQIHFPGQRWVNLQIEHELYCLGHLIEAGIAHQTSTGEDRLLKLVRRAADLLVRELSSASPEYTDGHEEIELALIRLYRHTGEISYLKLGRHFLENRGRIRFFQLHILRQNKQYQKRANEVAEQRKMYLQTHPQHAAFKLPAGNPSKKLPYAELRQRISQLSGKYFQQHALLRKQTQPVGHSVRFTYLETAAAMLARERGDIALRHTLEEAWERMVTRRMYVTGGLGGLPFIEGFGRDYELHPEYAYAETCAALGSLFWNHEMTLLTGDPRYADLFEWQLYNAVSVGIGSDGKSYFYNNPLTSRDGLQRASWYHVPCCPSNLSRTWAWLDRYLYNERDNEIYVHQYIFSEFTNGEVEFQLTSQFPYQGEVQLSIIHAQSKLLSFHLRIPSWAGVVAFSLNGQPCEPDETIKSKALHSPATGYDPSTARWVEFKRTWSAGDKLMITFEMPIHILRQDRRIPACGGMVAVTRGPIIYCLESLDNPGIDIFHVTLEVNSLHTISGNGDEVLLEGRTLDGKVLKFIPYMQWGNHEPSVMTVFVNT